MPVLDRKLGQAEVDFSSCKALSSFVLTKWRGYSRTWPLFMVNHGHRDVTKRSAIDFLSAVVHHPVFSLLMLRHLASLFPLLIDAELRLIIMTCDFYSFLNVSQRIWFCLMIFIFVEYHEKWCGSINSFHPLLLFPLETEFVSGLRRLQINLLLSRIKLKLSRSNKLRSTNLKLNRIKLKLASFNLLRLSFKLIWKKVL